MARVELVRVVRGAALVMSVAGAIVLMACGGGGAKPTAIIASPTPVAAATPPCDGERRLTPERGEGSFFRAGSPERTSLVEEGIAGTRLTVTGTVLSTNCRPVAGAVLDFWQADGSGAYDASGPRLRGHQTTGADGRYKLETIVPGAEPGRARSIHVKVQSSDGKALTAQLYFAGDASNATDDGFLDALAMDVQVEGGEKVAGFDFVLNVP